MVDLLNQYQGS